MVLVLNVDVLQGSSSAIQTGLTYQVKNPNQSSLSKFEYIDPGVVRLYRTDKHTEPKTLVETYAQNWFVGLISDPFKKVSISTASGTLLLDQPTGIFIPPYSIIHWQLNTCVLKWHAIIGDRSLPKGLPLEPALFLWDQTLPNSTSELFSLLLRSHFFAQVPSERTASAVGVKTKKYIDRHFAEELKISSMALQLGYSRSVMTRQFQACYGLSPIAYRHQLRVFESLRLMNQHGLNITSSAQHAGFSSVSKFDQHFRTIFGIPPSRYQAKNRSKK